VYEHGVHRATNGRMSAGLSHERHLITRSASIHKQYRVLCGLREVCGMQMARTEIRRLSVSDRSTDSHRRAGIFFRICVAEWSSVWGIGMAIESRSFIGTLGKSFAAIGCRLW